ncbi:MAG: hypothetical protein GY713_17470 [Actinomycetia bacterium]|nr:hypothetical protein [Actinomycetes bacterium]
MIDGFEEDARLMPPGEPGSLRDLLDCPQLSGIFTWSRGGGWMGPYIKDELWCDINTRVLVRWAHNPATPTGELVDQVLAELGFAAEHRPAMTELLDLSAKAVLCGVTGSRGDIDTLWTRDEFFGGFEDESPYMTRSVETLLATGMVEATLAELDEAVGIWRRIEELAATIGHADVARLAFIRTSCTYGRIYQEVIRAGWTVILLGEQGTRSGTIDAGRIATALGDYHQAWTDWRELSERPECPTLYRDTYCRYVTDQGMEPEPGMGASVARYEKLFAPSVSAQSAG